MYGREINGELHSFGVSGKLIMNALVMYDHQTRTLWSQFLGRGVLGPLEGTELEVIPVTQTTWSAWRQLHPDTLILEKDYEYVDDTYAGYYSSRDAGVFGETVEDDRLGPKELVLGINFDGSTKAYPFDVLKTSVVVNDSVAENELIVFFDTGTGTALVYDRRVNGRLLTFRVSGEANGPQTMLVDNETGSRWMAFTGRAVEGELLGETMNRLPSHLSFWFAWTDWNPDTDLYLG